MPSNRGKINSQLKNERKKVNVIFSYEIFVIKIWLKVFSHFNLSCTKSFFEINRHMELHIFQEVV
jgi:hypothetical protein